MKNNIFFTKNNYILIAVGLIVSILGFAIMAGGGSEDPSVFNYEIFSDRHITYSTFLVILGFVIVLVGIMKKFQPDVLESDNKEVKTKK